MRVRSRALQWGALFALWGLLGVASASCPPSEARIESVRVAWVIDGDTIKLNNGRHVRLIGLDTPELGRDGAPDQPFAKEARLALREMLPADGRIRLQRDRQPRDRYRRQLAHVYLADGRNLSAELLENGWATLLVLPPNTNHAECYRDAEARARVARRGLWSLPHTQAQSVQALTAAQRGRQYIQGRISALSQGRDSLWLDMEGRISLRIDRDDLPYFVDSPPHSYVGSEVRARGWLYRSRGNARLHIRHPVALERLGATRGDNH